MNNEPESDTPMTDALAKMYAQGVDQHYDGQLFCILARKFERELNAAKTAPPKSFLSAPDSIFLPCGHNSYWKTNYGNCMACRCENTEKELKESKDRFRKFADMVWQSRWSDNPDVDYPFLLAAEVRSGNYAAIDAAIKTEQEGK